MFMPFALSNIRTKIGSFCERRPVLTCDSNKHSSDKRCGLPDLDQAPEGGGGGDVVSGGGGGPGVDRVPAAVQAVAGRQPVALTSIKLE